jgi:arylsulfatase A-like enzyme
VAPRTQDSRPNFLLISLDCVRAWDFPGTSPSAEPMPILESLRDESVVFPRACSPAPWTIPAIGSLFTGLYPWEHGAHARGSLHLDDRIPRLPSMLRPAGYRSVSLASSKLISPPTGLTQGFDSYAWGTPGESHFRFNRVGSRPRPTESLSEGRAGDRGRSLPRKVRRRPSEKLPIFSILSRNIAALAVLHEVTSRIQTGGSNSRDDYAVGRWIEPTLEQWLGHQPPEAPVCAFVNLWDAHEPYFPDSEAIRTIGWRGFARICQDRYTWLKKRDRIPPEDNALLRQLYRRAIARMDARIGRIIGLFRDSDRWENTLFAVFGDHGQAFGEHGALFHSFRIEEPVIRIPLWVRFPRGELRGATAQGWANLVDIVPTCLNRAGVYASHPLSGLPLERLVDHDRPEPAFAMTDGSLDEPWIPLTARAELDRVKIAAYAGSRKLILDTSDASQHAYDVDRDPGEARDLWPAEKDEPAYLSLRLQEIADRLKGEVVVQNDDEVRNQLRSWGYA